MMKFVIHYYVIVMIIHIIHAQTVLNEDVGYIPASKLAVNGIIDKINNIVKFVQSKAVSQNKEELLNQIESKLMKAGKVLGPRGIKHVKLIMEGIRIKTSNITESGRKANYAIIKDVNNQSISLEELSHNFDKQLKSKLDKLNIKNKKLIAGDLKQSVLDFIRNNVNGRISNNTRRVGEFIAQKYSIKEAPQQSSNNYNQNDNNNTSGDDFLETTANQLKSLTANVDVCNNVYSRICSDVKALNSFKCLYDDVAIDLDKLCNSYVDCPDRSDESYCNTHVMKKVEFANRVMADVESSLENRCFEVDVQKSSLKKHTQVLQDVLRAQLNFKEKYQNISATTRTVETSHYNPADNEMLKRSANEIALIISSLSLALNGALCFHENKNLENTNDIFETNFDQLIRNTVWPPKNCNCKKELCNNCSDICKRICWHKHSLTRWNCESISNTNSVAIDVICDGKQDCFDESDEIECVVGTGYAKFQAHELYKNIVNIIQSRASKEQTSIRIKLLSLSNKITKLQEITTKLDPDRAVIKKLRNGCYTMLKSLYSNIISQSHFVDESEEAYIFLLSINKNLASALKRSHTGNNRIIADGCYCRNGTCAVPYCPKTCVKACSVESKIIKYRCQKGNASVSVNDICDGKRNCPNGYDELECQKEVICRRHHLIVLRHRLQEIGKKFQGTSLGELLQSWKIKVISTLKVAEKTTRPKPQVMKKIIKNMLRDLVLTYGLLEDSKRRSSDYALNDFITIAQQVMNALKSCGK